MKTNQKHDLTLLKTALAFALVVAILGLFNGLAPPADVKARADGLVVDLSAIPVGTDLKIVHDNQPVIIRHRSSKEIAAAESAMSAALRDQASVDPLGRKIGDADDKTRRATPDGKFIALIAKSDGCVVLSGAGDYDAWFDPCRGSHFDTSGRIRKGASGQNLRLPVFELLGQDQLRLLEPNAYLVPKATLEALGH